MKKIFLCTVLLLSVSLSRAQRGQIIAYIDMEYILENVPEYLEAQNTLDGKVVKWQEKLDKQARFIEVLKTDLANEKAILTKDLIEEKEEEISLKQGELRRLESLYFGPQGDMFTLRKQLVKPIQDQVYNAIQNISATKKYDFVFDKSSELVMLYSNKKHDISELVLSTIVKDRRIKTSKKKISAKKTEIQNKLEVIRAAKLEKKEQQKKAIQAKREALLAKRKAKRELLLERKNKKNKS